MTMSTTNDHEVYTLYTLYEPSHLNNWTLVPPVATETITSLEEGWEALLLTQIANCHCNLKQ